jgi:sodium/potassium-transporting ATPase subunit alpha
MATKTSPVIPREFSKTKEKINNKKDDKSELKKEVELMEHVSTPIAGIQKLGKEFGFQVPATIEEFMGKGMKQTEADKILESHHLNELTPAATTHWLIIFAGHMLGGFSLLLWAGAILCFISFGIRPENVDNLYLGSVLAIVVFLTGCFSYYQEAKSAAVMAGFKEFLPQEVLCTRDGTAKNMPAKFLVPGDVVSIGTGEKLPADVRCVETKNFKCDQSSLTGEPDAMKKKPENEMQNPLEASNLAFFGTMAVEGECKGFIVLTGDDTIIGRIAQLASGTENQETPIHVEIHKFIFMITFLAVFLGVTFLIAGFIKGYDPVTNLVFMIGIIVANVPEGLLATVTVSLTLTAKRLSYKQVLVKNLESVETLGSTTCICSDKTGTLTQNRMTVQHMYVNDEIITAVTRTEDWQKGVTVINPAPKQHGAEFLDDVAFQKLATGSVLCNNSKFDEGPIDPTVPGSPSNLTLPVLERRCVQGNASDYAFIKCVEALPYVAKMSTPNKQGIEALRESIPPATGGNGDIPFNSAYKFQVTIRDNGLVVMKGAAERVFERCDTILINGQKVPIDDKMQKRFEEVYKTLGKMGERVLGFAEKEMGATAPSGGWQGASPQECNYDIGNKCAKTGRKEKSDALCYIGLMALIDPPREAVPDSVLLCRRAGVKAVMVTGDHPVTAAAIAKTVNIMPDTPAGEVIEDEGIDAYHAHAKSKAIVCPGWELKDMTTDDIKHVLLYEQVVFARTSPAQKLIIVEAAQDLGHVVAVTGDGVNDSPALKAADIGCAMGIAGTDVSKEAADMILLTDDFSAIVLGIEEGRLIFDNLKKSIAYTLSSNIPEISPFLMFIIVQMPLSLTTVLILCVDLGTDMIPAISLAYEKPEADIMERPPRNAETDRLVTDRLMCFAYLQIGVFQALAGFYSFFVVLNDYGFTIGTVPGNAMSYFEYPGPTVKIPSSAATAQRRIMGGDKDVHRQYNPDAPCPCGGGELYPEGGGDNQFPSTIKAATFKTDAPWSVIKADGSLTGGTSEQIAACPASGNGFTVDGVTDDAWPYGYGCPYGSVKPTAVCKFKSTDKMITTKEDKSPPCYKPSEALGHAQTAAFVSIVIVQWADLLICKTRSLSIYHQGMKNPILIFGMFSETCLCLLLCYCPGVDAGLGTRPLMWIHWCPSFPYSVLIFIYDELRKFTLRRERIRLGPLGKIGFVERFSYY